MKIKEMEKNNQIIFTKHHFAELYTSNHKHMVQIKPLLKYVHILKLVYNMLSKN